LEAQTLSSVDLKTLIIAGASHLQRNKDMLDQLNVFPVPDGDTGTNMSLTLLSAVKEVEKTSSSDPYDIARAASIGALRGARGNSGVILSQLFRGFAKGLEGKQEITCQILSEAFLNASETAYKAVMKPKEGTILTVSKGMAEKAVELASSSSSLVSFLKEVISYGNEVLDRTPEMLPVLKQAGVVDAGGKGLLLILEGAYDALVGKEIVCIVQQPIPQETSPHNVFSDFQTEDITFGYCTEFIVNIEQVTAQMLGDLKSHLETIGDSIVVVSDDDIIKVHVHTDHPGQALEKALTIGPLTNLKIENMRDQHTHNLEMYNNVQNTSELDSVKPSVIKDFGFIAVAAGEGISEIFKQLGVDIVIQGGQTMNPSTEDFFTAVQEIPASTIFILPNNSNIILAAEQAQSMSDKKIFVIPTKTIPQGITSMIQFDPCKPAETNFELMKESLSSVKTGQITYAVRDTMLDSMKINKNDIIGILNGKITVITHDVNESAIQLICTMVDEDSEIISIYYGQDVSEEDAEKIQTYVQETYPNCEVELHFGGQPLYYYIISVE